MKIVFFQGYFEYSNNNKWIAELENVEGELLRCILPSEQETIKHRSKAIKLKYQVILHYITDYQMLIYIVYRNV